jgi:hypothetical protein
MQNKNWLDASLAICFESTKSRFPLGLCAYACASGVVEDVQTSTVLNVLLNGVGGDSHRFPFPFCVFPNSFLAALRKVQRDSSGNWDQDY